jgi:hypothetical protein
VNKALGPEMKSTESILFIDDLKDDQFYELYSRRKCLSKQAQSPVIGAFFVELCWLS